MTKWLDEESVYEYCQWMNLNSPVVHPVGSMKKDGFESVGACAGPRATGL